MSDTEEQAAPSLRRAKAEAKSGKAAAKQIEDYAFNMYGFAMKIPAEGMSFAKGATILNANDFSSTPFHKAIASMKKLGESPWRKGLALTDSERGDIAQTNVQRYLIVGFTYPELDGICTGPANHSSIKKQRPVSTVLVEGKNTNDVTQDGVQPLLVVTPVRDVEDQRVDLFVLLRPKNGLCSAFQCAQKCCFYLPVFRDLTTAQKERGPAWNRLVAKQAFRPSDRTPSAKQVAYKRARNTSKIVLEPLLSLRNELVCYAEEFAKGGERWHLEEMKAVLEQADADLKHMPPATNELLRKFVDNEEDFEDEDADMMVEELLELWPDMDFIDATDLDILKKQLVKDEVVVEYELLRPFLAEAGHCLEEARRCKIPEDGIASRAVGTVRRVLNSCDTLVPMNTENEESLLVAAIEASLKNLLKAGARFDKGLKDNCGDQTHDGTLHDIWEKYRHALDTDAAKKSWFEGARYMTAARNHKDQGFYQGLNEIVKGLTAMKIERGEDGGAQRAKKVRKPRAGKEGEK